MVTTQSISPQTIVDYEQSGASVLGLVLAAQKSKWRVLNSSGKEVLLAANRLHPYPSGASTIPDDAQEQSSFLQQLADMITARQASLNLQDAWEILIDETREYTSEEIAELLCTSPELADYVATRRALIDDGILFKRKKSGFEPRTTEAVEQLRKQAEVEQAKVRKREELQAVIIARAKGADEALPASISAFEQIAALGSHAQEARKWKDVIYETAEKLGLSVNRALETVAFDVLVAAKHFSPHENLALYKVNRSKRFSEKITTEAERIAESAPQRLEQPHVGAGRLIVSIDGADTKDIDDALSIEARDDGYRVSIHIADVASAISLGEPLFEEALARATSIYCPDFQIPMFPPALSQDALSLVEGKPRNAITFTVDIHNDGSIGERHVTCGHIVVSHRLEYDEVDEALAGEETSLSQDTRQLVKQLWEVASALEERRASRGAMAFHRREMIPETHSDGTVSLHASQDDSRSRRLVGEFMILANETAALFCHSNQVPVIFRSQEPPDKDITVEASTVTEGPAREYFIRSLLKRSLASTDAYPHAGLGLDAYTHITSPIRRVIDLLNQHQLRAHLQGQALPYSLDDIMLVKSQAEGSLSEANLVQREGTRYWLLQYLQQENIREIEGTIVRVDGPRPLAEIDILFSLLPFTPNKKANVARGGISKRRGERITLEIRKLEPRRNYIVLAEKTT